MQDGFKKNGKVSRNGSLGFDPTSNDSPSGMQNFHSPFGVGQSSANAGTRNKYGKSQNSAAALEYYASNAGGAAGQNMDMSETSSQHNMYSNDDRRGQMYNGSSLDMNRNESDMNIQRTVQAKKTKYNSLDRGDGDQSEISPIVMKKKANVHLQPMSHKKAPMMTAGTMKIGSVGVGSDGGGISHSESNPILNAPVINDRVKLDKLNHIPSVKSNLMSTDNMSNGKIEHSTPINYSAMPVGKKSVLAPIQSMNAPIVDNQSAVIANMQNNSALVNRKNNRTLKPI